MTRRILVTGSTSGIGAALYAMLRDDGDEVVGLDRGDCDIVCDLSDPSAIGRAAERIGAPLHGVAHVAGLPGTAEPESILAVNAIAPRLLSESLKDALCDGAAIVAVSSVTAARSDLDDAEKDALLSCSRESLAARLCGADGKMAYEHSKALLNRWAQHAARDLLPRGIRVNTVSPGPVATPILADFERSIGKERIAAAEKLAGRHGQPVEIAAAIRFLLAPEASWVNGTDLKVDGGYHALRALEGSA